MKDDKFCVSKTVAFLVSLIVIVGGIFYVMNYANNQQKTTESKADAYGGKCVWATVKNYPAGCGYTSGSKRGLSSAYNRAFTEDSDRNYSDKSTGTLISRCCIQATINKTVNLTGTPPPNSNTTKAQKDACTKLNGIIIAMVDKRCTFYTGGSYVNKFGYVQCSVGVSDDFNQCAAGAGNSLKNTTPKQLEILCKNLKGNVVPKTYVESGNGNETCMTYTGGYRKGNQPVTANADGDYTACLRDNNVDLLTYKVPYDGTKEYKTNNCY